MSARILVTISRSWTDLRTLRSVLEGVHHRHPDAVLVHGDCPRGDRVAAAIWRQLGGRDEPVPADWARYGRIAGRIRNQAMVYLPDVLGCLAFIRDHSRGASDCASRALRAGIPTQTYTQEGP